MKKIMMKRSFPCLAAIGMTVLLSACGFQLRGTGDTELSLRELSLSARDSYGETVKQVRTMLESNHVNVNPGATYTLYLAGEQQTQRTASYTAGARSAEIELTTKLPYEIRGRNDAVYLNHDLQGVLYQGAFIHAWPAGIDNGIGMPQLIPQCMADMGRNRCQ